MFKIHKIGNYISFGKVISALFYVALIVAFFLKRGNSFILLNFNNRIISGGTIAGIDINARNSFYYQAVVISCISFALFLLLFIYAGHFFKKKNAEELFIFEQKFYSVLSLVGIITLLFGLFGDKITTNVVFILCFQFLIILISSLKYLAKYFSWQSLTLYLSNKYFLTWHFLNAFAFMFYLDYFGKSFSIFHASHLSRNYVIGFIVNFIIFFAVFLIFTRKKNTNVNRVHFLITICSIPIFISPFYLPFANELYLILNQRGIFNVSPRKLLFCLLLASIITIGIIYWFIRKREVTSKSISKVLGNFYYPFLLVIFVAVLFQPTVTIGPPIELFESGNPGVTIDQLFRYGKIPILETFNAHALSELYAAVIYALLNGYQKWGSFLYNYVLDNTLYVIIGYFFMKRLLSNELALLTLMFFPYGILSNQILSQTFCFGMLAAILLFKAAKTPNYKNYLLFGFGLIFTFVWRYDLGASAIPAAIVTLFAFAFIYKKKIYFKKLVLAGITIGVFWLLAFVLLAELKHISVLPRLKELMAIVSSNQVWGYPTLGDNTKLNFYLYYILAPSLDVISLGYVLLKVKFYEKCKPEVFITVTYMLLFTLLNVPRGLVRHSIAENTTVYIVSLLAIPLCALPFITNVKKPLLEKYLKFSIIGFLYSFVVMSGSSQALWNDNSLLGQTVGRFSTFADYGVSNKKINRFDVSKEYSLQVYQGLKELFDQTMNHNETFIDFSNAPMLYVYTNRETPMYINQTPAFLSDEITQTSFLKEIKNYSIPYVVFPDQRGWTNTDGVPNQIRSYRVSEYIYTHFEPFTKLNGFDVWISKAQKTAIENKLSNLNHQPKEYSLFDAHANDTSKVVMNDIKNVHETKSGLSLDTGNVDPNISNLLNNASMDELPLANNNDNDLELDYSTKKPGNTQIYFKLNNEPFSDERSITIPSSANGITKITIPYSGVLQDIRIDPPSNNTFVLHSLKLRVTPNVYQKLDVSSANETADIGWVPYYWGEGDALNAKDKSPVELNLNGNQTINENVPAIFQVTSLFDKSKGNYLHLRLKSANMSGSYIGTVAFGDDHNANAASYTFRIQADGKYHDYLIRVSSQYNWYRLPVKFISISTEQNTAMNILSILKGD
jgi:hypothetical protein